MKISIITISYNSVKTIKATLNSILEQSYRPLEYVLVDGLSKDGTIEMIESYIHKFHESGIEVQFISEKDSGIYNAMNKGIKLCTGDIIGILNSNDRYSENSIVKEIAECFNSYSDIEGVFSDLHLYKNGQFQFTRM